jgi:hypothetical protein
MRISKVPERIYRSLHARCSSGCVACLTNLYKRAGFLMALESHIADITQVIQLAVAPVFLLTAVATLITALNNRLGRVVDRRRVLELQALSDGEVTMADKELRLVARRIRLIYFAILAAVLGALFVCLLVAGAFVGAFLSVDLSRVVAVLFILAMFALIGCLLMFLREVFLAVTGGGRLVR